MSHKDDFIAILMKYELYTAAYYFTKTLYADWDNLIKSWRNYPHSMDKYPTTLKKKKMFNKHG